MQHGGGTHWLLPEIRGLLIKCSKEGGRETVRKTERERKGPSFANFPLPATHETSHHTRHYVSLPDFNCEDPAASVDFRHLFSPPTPSPSLRHFWVKGRGTEARAPAGSIGWEWLLLSNTVTFCPCFLGLCPPWGLQIAENVKESFLARKEVASSDSVCVVVSVDMCVCGLVSVCSWAGECKQKQKEPSLSCSWPSFYHGNKSSFWWLCCPKSSVQSHIVLWCLMFMVENQKNPLLLKMSEQWGDQ